jgi:hypothetical protein
LKRKTARKSVRKIGQKPKLTRTAKQAALRRVAAGRNGKAPPPGGIDMLVAAQAAVLQLPIDPSWHVGVKFNLQLILRLGAMVDEFALPDDAEPGPVFHA